MYTTGAVGHGLHAKHLHLLSCKLQMSLKELPGCSCTLVAEVRCPVRLALTVCIQVCPQKAHTEVKPAKNVTERHRTPVFYSSGSKALTLGVDG